MDDSAVSLDVDPSQVVLVGECTTTSGPFAEDYFLVVVNRDLCLRTIPMGEAQPFLRQLETRLGIPLETALADKTDCASRVLFPEELKGRPFLSFQNPRTGIRRFLFAIAHFGTEEMRMELSGEIRAYIDAQARSRSGTAE
jgi:hypothetical protein